MDNSFLLVHGTYTFGTICLIFILESYYKYKLKNPIRGKAYRSIAYFFIGSVYIISKAYDIWGGNGFLIATGVMFITSSFFKTDFV